jgi:hypothetical protein
MKKFFLYLIAFALPPHGIACTGERDQGRGEDLF